MSGPYATDEDNAGDWGLDESLISIFEGVYVGCG